MKRPVLVPVSVRVYYRTSFMVSVLLLNMRYLITFQHSLSSTECGLKLLR